MTDARTPGGLCYPSAMKSWTTGAASFVGGVILALFSIIGGVGAITPSPNATPANLAQYETP
mgnify:CR=1 FL=1